MNKIDLAKDFAVTAHGDQLYGELPYVHHLASVVDVLADYTASEELLAAGWLHDVLEDTPVSRAEIEGAFGRLVSSVVWACTGVGFNRATRNASIYQKIALFPHAAIVKCADRIANVEHSKPGSKHRMMYARENQSFGSVIQPLVPPAMWQRLEFALERGE